MIAIVGSQLFYVSFTFKMNKKREEYSFLKGFDDSPVDVCIKLKLKLG